ncbi:MAG: Rpn family recombination-promoting nuclease/putative transposase [Deltaproteobacteria bacterium]|jgi:hypothetical protein|nr:Rpn family recombination-promoting nuclease/putative transposase [Deltaproteobacteria bacterium]
MKDIPAILPVLDDFVFRLIFADPENPQILAKFIRALMPEAAKFMKDLSVIDPRFNLENEPVRTGLVSALVTTDLELVYNIEIIVSADPLERVDALVYSKSRQVRRMFQCLPAAWLKSLVTTIFIADYPLTQDASHFINRVDFELANRAQGGEIKASGALWSYELPNMPENYDEPVLVSWLSFLKAKTQEELNRLVKINTDLREPVELLLAKSSDPKTRRLYGDWHRANDDRMLELYRTKSPGELWPEAVKLFSACSSGGNKGPQTRH